jgi:hypothetical protein
VGLLYLYIVSLPAMALVLNEIFILAVCEQEEEIVKLNRAVHTGTSML